MIHIYKYVYLYMIIFHCCPTQHTPQQKKLKPWSTHGRSEVVHSVQSKCAKYAMPNKCGSKVNN